MSAPIVQMWVALGFWDYEFVTKKKKFNLIPALKPALFKFNEPQTLPNNLKDKVSNLETSRFYAIKCNDCDQNVVVTHGGS